MGSSQYNYPIQNSSNPYNIVEEQSGATKQYSYFVLRIISIGFNKGSDPFPFLIQESEVLLSICFRFDHNFFSCSLIVSDSFEKERGIDLYF